MLDTHGKLMDTLFWNYDPSNLRTMKLAWDVGGVFNVLVPEAEGEHAPQDDGGVLYDSL